jgi:hypothetical protein
MPSQPHRPRLIRRAPPAPILLPRTSLPSGSQQHRPRLIRRVAPVSPPRTSESPQPSDVDHNSLEGNNDNDQEEDPEDLGEKRKRAFDSLRDALEVEVSRKKRKRGILK